MSPERFIVCQDILGFSNNQLIWLLDVDDRRFRRWKTGERFVPHDVEVWIEGLVKYFEEHPPPKLRARPREETENNA